MLRNRLREERLKYESDSLCEICGQSISGKSNKNCKLAHLADFIKIFDYVTNKA